MADQPNKIDDEVLALISDSIENDSLLRRDSQLACLTFNLESASIIISSNSADIVELKFERSTLMLDALPRHDSFLFNLKVGSLYLNDCAATTNKKKNFFPRIVYPKNTNSSDLVNFYVFELVYEHNPLLPNVKLKHSANLLVKSCGLDIIYNLDVIENIKRFFQRSSKHYAAASRILIRKTKKKTETEVKLNSSYHNSFIHKINFNFEITAPKVIFPQDFSVENPLVVIFDFGRLALVNRTRNLDLSLVSNSCIKKPKMDSNMEKILTVKKSNSEVEMFSEEARRRGSVDTNFRIDVVSDEDEDDDDDIFVTPSSTPTNEKAQNAAHINELDVSEGNLEKNLYSIYDLYLNDLQTVIGKYFSA